MKPCYIKVILFLGFGPTVTEINSKRVQKQKNRILKMEKDVSLYILTLQLYCSDNKKM